MIAAAASRHPERAAVISGERTVTYAELIEAGMGLTRVLAARGLQQGDRVAVIFQTKTEFLAAVVAVMQSGAAVVVLDATDAAGQESLLADIVPRYVLHDAGLAVDPSAFADTTFLTLDDVEAKAADAPSAAPLPMAAEDMALVIYTSGTTRGNRKGVMITHGNLAANTSYINGFMQVTDEIVEYAAAPVNHAFGFGRGRCVLAAGGTLVVDEGPPNPVKMLASFETNRCNALSSVSTGVAILLERLYERFAAVGHDMRWMEIGSLPLRRELVEKLCETFPKSRVVMNYGMTEAMRSTLIDFGDGSGKFDSVGQAAPGTAIRICDEAGRLLGPDEEGIIEVSGPHVAAGYWGKRDQWNERFHNGWFHTDDIGRMDSDGYLYFVARRDDVINVAGDKISPVEIEARLQPHLRDTAFCVCAITDPEGIRGEVPALCVEGSWPVGLDWKALQLRLVKELPSGYAPRTATVLETLPRTNNGKVRRTIVRRALEQGEGQPV